MDRMLLIPSARLVPPELRVDFGEIPSGMIPLDGRPVLDHIVRSYSPRGCRTVIAIDQQKSHILRYLRTHPELNATTVDVGPTETLGATIETALRSVDGFPESLIIHFGDTLIPPSLFERVDALGYAESLDVFRWTTFEIEPDGRIGAMTEKGRVKDGDGPRVIFIGAFAIGNVREFFALLVDANATRRHEIDPFYVAIETYFNAPGRRGASLRLCADWKDVGHLDTYYATRRALFLNRRAFNHVTVNGDRGTLLKTSPNSETLCPEIEWYLGLPDKLKHLAPRVFDYSLDAKNPFIELEFYGYPALNDVYLHGDWNPGVWAQVFSAIGSALDQMGEVPGRHLSRSLRVDAQRKMYLHKTLERLGSIVNDPRFEHFLGERLCINGNARLGLDATMELLPGLLENAGLFDGRDFTVIHGDLCLSNMLYDRRSGFVRLIDPRGEFGSRGIYGDQRYDLAKLCHSFEGDYDFLLNGQFLMSVRRSEIELHPVISERQTFLKGLFHSWIHRRCGPDYKTVRLIESLLFLSMVPLHADRIESQQAFLTRGLDLLGQAIERIPSGSGVAQVAARV